MQFGEKIKARREELGMTQDELAKKLGYRSRSTINKIELGINDIGQSKIIAFAKALNTTTSYLLDDCETEISSVIKLKLINLEQRRKELGLTLEEVGRYVGVSKSTVKKWETGYIDNMKRDKIALLSQALQVSPLALLGIEDVTQPKQSEIETLYSQLDSEDKAEVRGMIKGLLRADKYKKTNSIADDINNMMKAAENLGIKQK